MAQRNFSLTSSQVHVAAHADAPLSAINSHGLKVICLNLPLTVSTCVSVWYCKQGCTYTTRQTGKCLLPYASLSLRHASSKSNSPSLKSDGKHRRNPPGSAEISDTLDYERVGNTLHFNTRETNSSQSRVGAVEAGSESGGLKNKVTPAVTSFNVIRRYQTTRRKTEGVEGGWNNPESFKSSVQYSLSLSFKVLYNLINRIKVIG